MSIAEEIRNKQNIKEMTKRAIKILVAAGQDVEILKKEFFDIYGEEI